MSSHVTSRHRPRVRPGAGVGSEGKGVQSITTAPEPHSVDLNRRMRRYAWQMALRTVCFVAAFFTHGWLQILLLLGAIVLPYIAVLLANNGTVTNGMLTNGGPSPAPPAPRPSVRELDPGSPATGTEGRAPHGP